MTAEKLAGLEVECKEQVRRKREREMRWIENFIRFMQSLTEMMGVILKIGNLRF